MGPCQITKNQINLDQIEIIQFWTFWTFFGHFGHFLDILYLNHLIPLQGYFLFSCSKASDANIGIIANVVCL